MPSLNLLLGSLGDRSTHRPPRRDRRCSLFRPRRGDALHRCTCGGLGAAQCCVVPTARDGLASDPVPPNACPSVLGRFTRSGMALDCLRAFVLPRLHHPGLSPLARLGIPEDARYLESVGSDLTRLPAAPPVLRGVADRKNIARPTCPCLVKTWQRPDVPI